MARWIDTHAEAWLPFAGSAVRYRTWATTSGGTQLHTWDNGQLYVDADISELPGAAGALTASGYIHDAGTLLSHSELATRMGATSDPTGYLASCGGIFSVCMVDANGDILAWASRGRLHSVFCAETPEVCVVSNRPHAAHLVSRRKTTPDFSDEHAIGYLASGLVAPDGAPFEGVEQLADGAQLRCTTRGTVSDSYEYAPSEGLGDVSAVTRALVEAIAFLSEVDADIGVSLSGGKDSRLIVALLHEAGVPFRASTSGFPDHPDVVVGRRVAEALALDHNVVPPGGGGSDVIDLIDRIVRVTRGSDGLLSGFENPFPVWKPAGPVEQEERCSEVAWRRHHMSTVSSSCTE